MVSVATLPVSSTMFETIEVGFDVEVLVCLRAGDSGSEISIGITNVNDCGVVAVDGEHGRNCRRSRGDGPRGTRSGRVRGGGRSGGRRVFQRLGARLGPPGGGVGVWDA